MSYAEYRRQGPPITSSLIESTVKQVGRRVKGTEKSWSEAGSETIPQLRADYLSDTSPMPTMVDGGRIQIRQRGDSVKDENAESEGYWRESLVGCCLSMSSEEHPADPCPTIPKTFVAPERMGDLSREIKGFSGHSETGDEPPEASPDDRDGRPRTLVKSVVATSGPPTA